ncbi:MnhB domain-containing protein [Bogoriella caseilytica]|uniref:Multisubunit sodium/proton antiporter MrpB subunit n=1 Tax=Bogoriella caseilytica TaxID=56055 RepID=A0A3N2BCJ1_9MICO|nr:MnhB domain-containing protein [Bogoriella caseilytica]ROR72971.1 multisubunit sodium/proton antiporter MrpB subunit [Bogoriella caseilytica]
MIPALDPAHAPEALDVALGLALCVTAALALIPRSRLAQSMAFLGLGVLMTLTWLRLGSVDVALAEAALGTGLLSALLVWLAARGRPRPGPDAAPTAAASEAGGPRRFLVPALGVLAGAVAALIVLGVWSRAELLPPQWGEPLAEQMDGTGVTHEITGVLLSFRAYDTLLESAVLMFAAVAVLALGRDDGFHALRVSAPAMPSTLRWLVRATAPVLLLLAFWLLVAGSSQPGGAFQSGAVLAGLLILLRVAQVPVNRRVIRALPALLVAGVIAFLAAGLLGPAMGQAWLAWDPAWAFAAVFSIEVLLTCGIAAALSLLYLALENPVGAR